MRVFFIFFSLLILTSYSASAQKENVINKTVTSKDIKVGAECTNEYFPLIKGKNIAIVANQTSLIGNVHLVDSLLKTGIKVKKIFCPEHGFRGDADAGEKLDNYKDSKTGLPVISLYGNSFKPKNEDLKGIDFLIFDIQDVGVRFYTYISVSYTHLTLPTIYSV